MKLFRWLKNWLWCTEYWTVVYENLPVECIPELPGTWIIYTESEAIELANRLHQRGYHHYWWHDKFWRHKFHYL